MTRIVVLCDGTWNSPKLAEPTHVVKLRDALVNQAARGQLVAYFPGIGTEREFDGPVKRFFNKFGGGAFGWGLDGKVKRAYQFIARAHQHAQNPEIYLFGFSRGAYTARSVAGMIRKCGIVEDTSPESINAAFKLYRKRGKRNHPDADHIQKARARISPHFATSAEDVAARGRDVPIVDIAFMGVWDTVGARGIPVAVLGPVAALWNLRYRFHDMVLSSLVRSARHAVALDETKKFYRPALWNNLDGDEGLNGAQTGPLKPYQQLWFVGHHGTVGGSSREQPLAALAQDWVFRGAGRLTLLDDGALPTCEPDPLYPYTRPDGLFFRGWREGPKRPDELHSSVHARLEGDPGYRPGSLKQLDQ
ncbi:MAG: DUF2235 domain-containing protein [Alphaproteobacteria bacterium]|nr:DUF2235 domain-containing protein [Alphaproteobacteria bacterium]